MFKMSLLGVSVGSVKYLEEDKTWNPPHHLYSFLCFYVGWYWRVAFKIVNERELFIVAKQFWYEKLWLMSSPMFPGYVGSTGGSLAGFPQHCDQRQWTAATIPGVSEGREVWWSHPEGYRTSDGSVQPVWWLAQDYLLLYCKSSVCTINAIRVVNWHAVERMNYFTEIQWRTQNIRAF